LRLIVRPGASRSTMNAVMPIGRSAGIDGGVADEQVRMARW
jgi:hypothetical protein